MAKEQPWKDEGLTKAEWIEREVAAAVNAGKAWDLETVDFSDPNRPLTCLEVDFPIIPINRIAAIEGNAMKPVYQLAKWWAWRRSSVFRAMLLAAATRAPDDSSEAAKQVWSRYYGNHQSSGTLQQLRVADIFMGGGTTVVEGSRLGLQMYGNDLNPVSWLVVKNRLAEVDPQEVDQLLSHLESDVRPQVAPFFSCSCPRGHSGRWLDVRTGDVKPDDFVPTSVPPRDRSNYRYEGPEVIYAFWSKHGECTTSSCRHRTPVLSSPLLASKTLSVRAWSYQCSACDHQFEIEERDARMAPGIPLLCPTDADSFAVAQLNQAGKPGSVTCPSCGNECKLGVLPKPVSKKVSLSLLVHPSWLAGEPRVGDGGIPFGGSVDEPVAATLLWNNTRATHAQLVEVRGPLPDMLDIPDWPEPVPTNAATKPKDGQFSCSACGKANDYLDSVKTAGHNGPVAVVAQQCYCPECDALGEPYGGKFYQPVDNADQVNAAFREWDERSQGDLKGCYPDTTIPYGERTHVKDPLPKHGFTRWRHLFNPRQLLVHSLFAKSLDSLRGELSTDAVLYGTSALQQYVRYQNMLAFWHRSKDHFAPALSNPNYNPKDMSVEVGVFVPTGYGPWRSVIGALKDAAEWKLNPWELVAADQLGSGSSALRGAITTKSVKVFPQDPMAPSSRISCCSSTELPYDDASMDLVVTDPPFGDLLQYSELADFLYAWSACLAVTREAGVFGKDDTPKALECVSNGVRHNEPSQHYKRLLTACYAEAHRVLKAGGLLAFTFHHSEDEPWVDVLEALFDAGFALVSTFPIRSDETKGDNAQFGSQKIEYDIIHVCRKRDEMPSRISWAKLRRHVIADVREIRELLEHHQEEGLPEADLQVIRRGKALEYFSRHYGQVYKNPDTPMSVLEALLGINQLLDEEAGGVKEPPPHNAEPFTRMMLRLFDGVGELPRDQMQKFLRGTGSAPSDFVGRGWVTEKKKVFYLVPPLDIARDWVGKQRRGMTSDYDQAMYLIGACFENSGIVANDTLNNANFRPHPALGAILTWFKTHGADSPTRNAAITASQLYKAWEAKNQPKAKELTLFDMLGEDD
tara:strand:+ start:5004 stop:8255 length:3252 start_codon:yes stop_codon:yes gene_type:complete